MQKTDEKWMRVALDQAASALSNGEFPVGCVLVNNDRLVGSGARMSSAGTEANELDHAEIIALRDWLDSGRLGSGGQITAYVTLEPCFMCLGALMINGISRIVFAYEDVMGGACGTDFSRPLTKCKSLLSKRDAADHIYTRYRQEASETEIIGGFMRTEALGLFYDFFSNESCTYLNDTFLARYTLEQGKRLNITR